LDKILRSRRMTKTAMVEMYVLRDKVRNRGYTFLNLHQEIYTCLQGIFVYKLLRRLNEKIN
jgi:hypothetical protein